MFVWLGTYQKYMKKRKHRWANGQTGEGRAAWTDGHSRVSKSLTFWHTQSHPWHMSHHTQTKLRQQTPNHEYLPQQQAPNPRLPQQWYTYALIRRWWGCWMEGDHRAEGTNLAKEQCGMAVPLKCILVSQFSAVVFCDWPSIQVLESLSPQQWNPTW